MKLVELRLLRNLLFHQNPWFQIKKQFYTIQFQNVQEASGLQYQVLTAIQKLNATFY
jgi:hypothetical protein